MSDVEDTSREDLGREDVGREDLSREDLGRKDPTARLEAALERISIAVDRRRPAGAMTPDVTQEVAARLDVLIRQIRGVLQPVEG